MTKLKKPLKEWRTLLSPAAYDVLFEEATERPRSSSLNDEKRPGTYVCAACYLPLFDASTKYESGTGWPSFYAPIEDRLETKRDWKLILPRTEYHCARCEGHQGHLFGDGPAAYRSALVQQRRSADVRAAGPVATEAAHLATSGLRRRLLAARGKGPASRFVTQGAPPISVRVPPRADSGFDNGAKRYKMSWRAATYGEARVHPRPRVQYESGKRKSEIHFFL